MRSDGRDEHWFASIPELRRRLRRREVSALELARAALERLDGVGRRLRVVAELTPERAERDARAADAALRRGTAGPLCGIPYGAKDLLDAAGVPTRWGAPPYRDRIAQEDATAVRRMRAAGAVLVAKLSLIELAGAGGYRDSAASIDGACLNPWDVTRWSGGSSSGSAAAVAAGLIPASLGSETGGSLVIPASFCGVTTLRPSFGAASRHGAMTLAWSMDKIGPLAGTVDEVASVFAVVSGRDEADWTTAEWSFRPTRRRAFRLGVLPNDFSGADETRRVFERAVGVLTDLGMSARAVTLPAEPYQEIYQTVLSAETAAAHQELISSEAVDTLRDPAQRDGLRRCARVTVPEYARAVEARARIARALRALFGEIDALIAPTVLTEATTLAQDLLAWREHRGGYAHLGALAGLPAVSVPMGVGAAGLPLGLSITGDLFGDGVVLRIGSLYQGATSWHLRHPAMQP